MALAREAIRLGTTVYGDHTADPPSGLAEGLSVGSLRTVVQHMVPGSLIWPQKDIGPEPLVIDGYMLLHEDDVDDFRADVGDGSAERKLHFIDGGLESYAWVRSGTVSEVRSSGLGLAAEMKWVHFSFTSTRTTCHLTSDDSVKWGGS